MTKIAIINHNRSRKLSRHKIYKISSVCMLRHNFLGKIKKS